ncbi:hypothetical protein JCM11641_007206 [Rhodosporidiobolus odoratus]
MLALSLLVYALAPLAVIAVPTSLSLILSDATNNFIAAATGTLHRLEGYTYGSVKNVAEFPVKIIQRPSLTCPGRSIKADHPHF